MTPVYFFFLGVVTGMVATLVAGFYILILAAQKRL
jgi:hypothetical protein